MGFDLQAELKKITDDEITLLDGTVLKRRIKTAAVESAHRALLMDLDRLSEAELSLIDDKESSAEDRVKAGNAVRAAEHRAIAQLLTDKDGKVIDAKVIADGVDSTLLRPLRRYLEGRGEFDPFSAPTGS